jgi:hypothetical protein
MQLIVLGTIYDNKYRLNKIINLIKNIYETITVVFF